MDDRPDSFCTKKETPSAERLWVACATGRRLLLADGLSAVVRARPDDALLLASWLSADQIVIVREDGCGGSWPGPWDHRFAVRVLAESAAARVGVLDHVVVGGGRSGSVRRERPDLGWARPSSDRGRSLC